MLDTINGLPVHVLVIHAVVVLLPLMALVTIAFTVRAKWRPGLPWAILGNLAATGAAYAAVLSGRNLQTRLSTQAGREIAKRHGELGVVLPYFGIGLVVASVLSYLLVGRTRRTRRSSPDWDGTQQDAPRASGLATAVAVVLVLAAGAAATTWTYRVGDSGAQEVWHATIANTKAP